MTKKNTKSAKTSRRRNINHKYKTDFQFAQRLSERNIQFFVNTMVSLTQTAYFEQMADLTLKSCGAKANKTTADLCQST